MAKHAVSEELDEIAEGVQALSKRHPKYAKKILSFATAIDTVSNQFDLEATRTARTAAGDPDQERGAWGFEGDYDDSFEADPKKEHKVPIGNDSLSKAIDKQPSKILSDLDFAQSTNGKDGHRIFIQANRNKRSREASTAWPFKDLSPKDIARFASEGRWDLVRKASLMADRATGRSAAKVEADDEMNVDEGNFGDKDRLTTADLGESGDEDIAKPVDADQDGGTLQFYGTYAQTENDDGPDSGHHRRNVAPPNRGSMSDISASRRTTARTLLERVADRPVKPEVKDPDDLLNDEPGNNVERDQPLGGLSGQYKGRKSARGQSSREAADDSEVKVYRPTHVPQEMHGMWHRAAQRIASEGKLLKATGKVNYYAIDDKYRGALKYYRRQAFEKLNGRQASRLSYKTTPRSVRIQRPEYVPRELNAYWNGAAEYLGNKNRLVTASGKIDYDGVTRQYTRLLDTIASVPAD